MKIMSLNVNQFRPVGLMEGSKGKESIAAIKIFLFSDNNNVVFLQEVPSNLLDELEKEINRGMAGEKYEIIRLKIEQTGKPIRVNAYTIAIVKSGVWKEVTEDNFKQRKKDLEKGTPKERFEDKEEYPWFYENKFIEIRNEKLDLQLLGVHCPWQKEVLPNSVTVFFEALKQYAKVRATQRFAIIGDMNADTVPDSVCHEALTCFEKDEYTLLVKELGNVITYFPKKTRIDHVAVSRKLSDKATAQVIPEEALKLSDHAVIIVDIKE